MGIQKLQEMQGITDLGIFGKVKRRKGKRLNDGCNPNPLTNDSKNQRGSTHILAKLDINNGSNHERCIGTGDNMKEKNDTYKKINDLRLLDGHNMEDDTNYKSSKHNESEKLTSSKNFFDEGIPCSENRAIDEGFKGSRKYTNEQNREKKRRKQNGTDFNSLKNDSAEGGETFEDEIIYGGPTGSEKDLKMQRKRNESLKETENSTTSTDNCGWDEGKEQDRKRRKKYFLEHEQGQDNSKKMSKEASEKACKVISGGDAEEVPLRAHVRNKDKKRGKEKGEVDNCPELTPEMAARKNYVGKSKLDVNSLNIEKGCNTDEPYHCEPKKDVKKGKKKVSFSENVEEFPPEQFHHENLGPDNLVWGKRFTPEEDELIRNATMKYIEENQLGEQGLHMILHCKSYRKEVKDCWKVISAALPWRPPVNTFFRAHILFERSEERKWEPEELELIKRYHAEHGPKWRKLADVLGKSRVHVKDAWRRIRLPNLKKGRWSQYEYQSLFDLVNLDLRMKAFEEKKANHCMLKDNISWEAISDKMSTRGSHTCCSKWYYNLASSMVKEGSWNNLDDYKLIEALQKADACCFEDVDWDNLLAHRSGEICRKRWHEMIRHLHNFWALTFIEQVDLLSARYSPDMIQYREMEQNKNHNV
ncbi:uncharacterized protein LOC110023369 [Phalaenopsis equestris]|uniref:uncharacterized protein LOC110023369 n=1 Tax=Phalaenopsis equestris TaxID=78828 RepID=UPI0009E50E92|nr:uncharacterized protein LOC110023369 [Phalaenopsis equestris]